MKVIIDVPQGMIKDIAKMSLIPLPSMEEYMELTEKAEVELKEENFETEEDKTEMRKLLWVIASIALMKLVKEKYK